MAYVYRHIRHDKNEPFYIGISSDKSYKRSREKKKRNPIWKKIANKTTYDVEIIFDNISIEDAKQKEIEFVNLYGRILNSTGTLANISGGGGGLFNITEEMRKQFSVKFTGIGNPFYGKKHTDETRRLLSQRQAGQKRGALSEQTRNKISGANKGSAPPLKGKKDAKGSASRTGIKHPRHKGEIYCYDTECNLLRIFGCSRDAAIFCNTNCNSIRRVIIGERNHFKGYVFCLKDQKPNLVKILDNTPKKVLDTKTGIIYDNILTAAKAFEIPARNLGRYLTKARANKTTLVYNERL